MNRCTGFTSGCSGTIRAIGGSVRHSARATGAAGGVDLRRHGHIAKAHRPCVIRVLMRAISAA